MRVRALVALAGIVAFTGVAETATAAYPGENGKIVYEHKKDQFNADSAAWTVSAGNPASGTQLVNFEEPASNFVYSPNGRKIAFGASVPSQEIVVMNSNGTRPKVITSRITRCIGKQRPTWSPDGRKIAFQCLNSRGFNQHDIWSVNADGSGIKQISKTHDAYFPAWSPLGDEIAYTSSGGVIYTVPAEGGPSSIVSEEAPPSPDSIFGGTWNKIDWSPEGETLVADSSGDGIKTIDMETLAVSGDLANIGSEPVFSPDGDKILYVGVEESRGDKLDLWMMNPDGSRKQRVTSRGYDRAPNWGPRP